MGIFSTIISAQCTNCHKWFDVQVGSFLGFTLAGTIIQRACPHCGSLITYVVR